MLRWAGWALIAMLFVFLCGLLAAAPMSTFLQNNVLQFFTVREGTDAQRSIQQLFGVNLPANATNFHYANLGDQGYWIQFSMNPQSLNGAFRGSPFLTCVFPLVDNYRPTFDFYRMLNGTRQNQASWWQPRSANSYTGGECTGSDYKIFRMFADTGNPGQWTFSMEVVRT
ncbi:MAG: hypothetical protein K8L99_19950 [Anaerolineae bacterium]|nr:hypothetical protein [Anaerolineae bacterium]